MSTTCPAFEPVVSTTASPLAGRRANVVRARSRLDHSGNALWTTHPRLERVTKAIARNHSLSIYTRGENLGITIGHRKVWRLNSSHYNRKLEKCLVRISETLLVADIGLDRRSALFLFDAFDDSMLAVVPFKGDCAMRGERTDCDKVDQFKRDMSQ